MERCSPIIPKISVIGLDGMNWSYLEKIFETGSMPYTKNLINKSQKYVLQSTFPPMSYPSWLSIMTGVNPGKHGIFGFTFVDRTLWESKVFNTLHLEHPRIHEILAMIKIKSIMINPMPGYPIIPLDGTHVISDVFVPRTIYYPSIMEKYANILTDNKAKKGSYIEETLDKHMKYLSIVEDTVDKLSWSLYWITLRQPDESTHKSPRDVLRLSHGLRRVFKIIDKIIETLALRSDIVVIVSDHGFKMCKYGISINDILLKHGFICLKKSSSSRESSKTAMFLAATKFIQKIPPLARFARDIYIKLSSKFRFKTYYKQPDFSCSQAFMYSASSFGVYVKSPTILSEVKAVLLKYKGIKWVKQPNHIYQGPYLARAPDLLIMPDLDRDFKLASSNIHGTEYIAMNEFEHYPEGIFSIYSSEVSLAKTIRKVPAWTVAQLILTFLGVPISHLSDDTAILNKITGESVRIKTYNYTKKWELVKKVFYLKRKIHPKIT